MWQLSISFREAGTRLPVPVLRWSPTKWRKAEGLRDRIMRGAGTDEPWHVGELSRQLGMLAFAVHFRKPLRIDEVARMAATPDVRERRGRG